MNCAKLHDFYACGFFIFYLLIFFNMFCKFKGMAVSKNVGNINTFCNEIMKTALPKPC